MKFFSILIVALFLAGCSTTEQANTALASKYVGQKTDAFFLRFGPPISRHQLDDGRTMFVWAEKARNYTMPSTSTVNVIGSTAFVNTSPSSTIEVQCQVRIVSGMDGFIEQVVVQNDSIGDWQLSRCNEVFNRT